MEEVQSLQCHLKEIESNFNSNRLHEPTVRLMKADMDRFREISETSKRAEVELHAVLNALKKDITECGFNPVKFDELLEATRKEYRVEYEKGKNKVSFPPLVTK